MSTLVTPDGIRLWFGVDGPDGAPRVVLLPGLGSDSRAARPLVDAIGDRAQVARLDLRGHGRSEVITEPARFVFFSGPAGDVVALLDELQWDRAHLVGGSLGAAVALAVALATPARVRSLTLLTPAIGAGTAFAANPLAEAFAAAVVEHGFGRVLEVLEGGRPGPGAVAADDLAAVRAEYGRQDPAAMQACMAALREAVLVSEPGALAAVAAPTLVIGRPGDPFHPLGLAHDLVARIAGARRIDDDPAKAPLWQRPVELAGIIVRFVESVERAAAH